MQKTWFITGASRGLGVAIAQAAIRAGDRVVATSRDPASVTASLGPDSDNLLAVGLDVAQPAQAQAAIAAALTRFGSIDVLVNNAGYGHLGFFEETAIADVEAQFATNLFGVFHVTWAALPAMRAARSGRIFNLSSLGGVKGTAFTSLYSASKFALEGFSEALAEEVKPFGLFVTIVEPGPFRTDFLTTRSMRFVDQPIPDYDVRRAEVRAFFEKRDGTQPGDPERLAEAMVRLAGEPVPPMRFTAGSVAVDGVAAKLAGMAAELERWRPLSLSTDYQPSQHAAS